MMFFEVNFFGLPIAIGTAGRVFRSQFLEKGKKKYLFLISFFGTRPLLPIAIGTNAKQPPKNMLLLTYSNLKKILIKPIEWFQKLILAFIKL